VGCHPRGLELPLRRALAHIPSQGPWMIPAADYDAWAAPARAAGCWLV